MFLMRSSFEVTNNTLSWGGGGIKMHELFIIEQWSKLPPDVRKAILVILRHLAAKELKSHSGPVETPSKKDL